MNKGFTMIEMLISLFFIPLVFSIISAMLLLMQQFRVDQPTQSDVFELQLRQLLIRSTALDCASEKLQFSYDNQLFTIVEDRDRIIKQPGYEILLNDVHSVSFSCEEGIVLTYWYQKIRTVFHIELP